MPHLLPGSGKALIEVAHGTLLYSMQPLYYGTVGFSLVGLAGGMALGYGWLAIGAASLLLISSLAFWLERQNWVLTGRIIFTALAFTLVTLLFILFGTYSAAAFFYGWPLLVALLLIGPEITMGLALATGGLLLIILFLERFIGSYSAPVKLDPLSDNIILLVGLLILSSTVGIGYLHLGRRLLHLQTAMRQQSNELFEILAKQARLRDAYQILGEQVANTAGQLWQSSDQQATGAAQQVNALVQITTSMHELSQTATQITERSKMVQQTSAEVAKSALAVATTTTQVSEASQRGQKSVDQTATSNQVMQNAYQSLKKRLEHLSEHSLRIQAMLGLIDTISDETHLLSLNAAIEAAGAGEHGERFGVVAQEVKNLADRARRTSAEVRHAVTEVEAALQAAQKEAANGDAIAEEAALSAWQSALVIAEFEEMVTQAVQETSAIATQAAAMETIAREIGFATRLQQNASEQVLGALLTVQKASEVNAVSSSEITSGTSQLQNLASRFNNEI